MNTRSFEAVVRGALLALVAMSSAGLFAELLLIGHYDEIWQMVPLALLGLGLLASLVAWMAPSKHSLRWFQTVMLAFIIAGTLGVWRHYAGNVDWELERRADLRGWKLAWESARGATPLLAPFALAQLGLMGLLYTFRHPALGRREQQPLSGNR